MVAVAWPLSSAPGYKQQEGTGRLINVFAEPRGNEQPAVWRRVPGAVVFARTPSVGDAAGQSTAMAVSSVTDVAAIAAGDSTALGVSDASAPSGH